MTLQHWRSGQIWEKNIIQPSLVFENALGWVAWVRPAARVVQRPQRSTFCDQRSALISLSYFSLFLTLAVKDWTVLEIHCTFRFHTGAYAFLFSG